MNRRLLSRRRSRFVWSQQSRWEKVGYLCFLGWVVVAIIYFFVDVQATGEFLDKTHQVEVGMALQNAVAILGESTKQQKSREDFLRHDERPRWPELGKENPLTEITWDGTRYIFRAFVVKDEIIVTRIKRKGVKK